MALEWEAFRTSNALGKIGVVIDVWKRIALTDSPDDIELANDEDEENWKFYCDRVFKGRYSDYILHKFEEEGSLMEMQDQDFRLGSLPIDFYGTQLLQHHLGIGAGAQTTVWQPMAVIFLVFSVKMNITQKRSMMSLKC